jgi:hypothetical protein
MVEVHVPHGFAVLRYQGIEGLYRRGPRDIELNLEERHHMGTYIGTTASNTIALPEVQLLAAS